MLLRTLSFAFGLLAAVAASQLPEFAQQYRQRLGGAIDELNGEVSLFGSEAQNAKLTPQQAVQRLQRNSDDLAQKRGSAMDAAMARLDRLQRQRDSFAQAGPMTRVLALFRDFDPTIAANAYEGFEPAVPTTAEGFVTAVIGFFAGYGILRLLGLPFRRRPRPALVAVREPADEAQAARARGILLRQRINRYTLPRLPTVKKR